MWSPLKFLGALASGIRQVSDLSDYAGSRASSAPVAVSATELRTSLHHRATSRGNIGAHIAVCRRGLPQLHSPLALSATRRSEDQ